MSTLKNEKLFIPPKNLIIDMQKVYNKIIKGIKAYFKKNNFNNAVIGLSGGIDSSLSACLAAKAIGNNNVFGILMPEIGVTQRSSIDHAVKLANIIKIKYTIQPISEFLRPFNKIRWQQNKIAVINTKSRIRANILYNYANTHTALVIGTSNKSEILLGYFTKHGDGAADIEVIGSLYKTHVYELAKFLKLPKEIIERQPTAELFHGHTDEEELGGSYEEIDKILKTKNFSSKLGKSIRKRMQKNEHKRVSVPIIRI